MNTLELFKQQLALNSCPFCNKALKFYDGCLGYEAYRCYDCGINIDNNGLQLDLNQKWWGEKMKSYMALVEIRAENEEDFKEQLDGWKNET